MTNVTEKMKFVFGMETCWEKERKCWFPAFAPLPKMFSKTFFFKVVKS